MNTGHPVAGSQSLVSSTNSVSVTTSATTTAAAASGLVVDSVSPSVSVSVATPAKGPVAGLSCNYGPGSFHSTWERSHVPPKRPRVEPILQSTAKEAVKMIITRRGSNLLLLRPRQNNNSTLMKIHMSVTPPWLHLTTFHS